MSIVQDVKGFFSNPFNRNLAIILLLLGGTVYFLGGEDGNVLNFLNGNNNNNQTIEPFVYFFYYPGCPHCHEQDAKLNPILEERYNIKILRYNVQTSEGNKVFQELSEKYNLRPLVPLTIVGDYHFTGYNEGIGEEIDYAIERYLETGGCENVDDHCVIPEEDTNRFVYDLPFIGETDLLTLSLPILAITIGLVDGFNPCAMWVLVYLISVVITLEDKRKIWLIVGTFVLASGILYFLFMTAWLNLFLIMGYVRPLTILIGLIALGGAIINIKDFYESKGGPIACKVTSSDDKTKTMGSINKLVNAPLTVSTFIAIVILAFVVNSVEFVCSAALPAVFTQILALSSLTFIEYYGYIALYVFAFMFDDLVIFGTVAFAVTHSGLGDKYATACKLIGGIILLLMGIMLLFFPGLMM
jgi:fumarate reductase subunit C